MSPSEGLGPAGVRSRRRRRRLRRELERAVDELAARADRAEVTVWRVQPVIEICAAEPYPTWRNAREQTWRRERTQFSTRTWPDRLRPATLAGAFLPQSHGGHYRGRPAEIALPVFSYGTPPPPDRDFEHPYEPLVLALSAAWTRMILEDHTAEHAVLLARPLVDMLGGRPRPRIPHELGITWPLQPSQPHIQPSRRAR